MKTQIAKQLIGTAFRTQELTSWIVLLPSYEGGLYCEKMINFGKKEIAYFPPTASAVKDLTDKGVV